MKKTFLQRQIFRCNRNFIIANTMALLFFLILFGPNFADCYNTLFGPFKITNKEVTSMNLLSNPRHYSFDPKEFPLHQIDGSPLKYNCYMYKGKYYFTLKPEAVIHTNLNESIYKENPVARTNSDIQFIETTFFLVKVNSKYLAVQVPRSCEKKIFKGVFVPLNKQSRTWIINVTHEMYPETEGNVLPFMLDTVINLNFVRTLSVLFILPLLIIIPNYIRIFLRIASILDHPINKKIKKAGLDQQDINQEIENQSANSRESNPIITTKYIIKRTLFGLSVLVNKNVSGGGP